ncbi:MAG: hypothetical protein JW874_14170 [Spirochaetales bacterium]|nr:hypothetical protein [Spirochaetales bacterium]
MKFSDIVRVLKAEVILKGSKYEKTDVQHVCAADLMSEVLVENTEHMVIVTALTSEQTARTADIVDALGIILINAKHPEPEMRRLMQEMNISCISTSMSMFECCVELGKLLPANRSA